MSEVHNFGGRSASWIGLPASFSPPFLIIFPRLLFGYSLLLFLGERCPLFGGVRRSRAAASQATPGRDVRRALVASFGPGDVRGDSPRGFENLAGRLSGAGGACVAK